jgi:hypothetical protein
LQFNGIKKYRNLPFELQNYPQTTDQQCKKELGIAAKLPVTVIDVMKKL